MQNEAMKSEVDSPFKPVTRVRISLGSLAVPSETTRGAASTTLIQNHPSPTTTPPQVGGGGVLVGRSASTLNAIKPALLASASADIADRFAAKFTPEPNTGCWLWTAALNNCGYGVLSLGSRVGNTSSVAYAHRVSWELAHGPIPEGLTLDHRCNTRSCTNPAHLEPVTHKENCRRREARAALELARLEVATARLAEVTP